MSGDDDSDDEGKSGNGKKGDQSSSSSPVVVYPSNFTIQQQQQQQQQQNTKTAATTDKHDDYITVSDIDIQRRKEEIKRSIVITQPKGIGTTYYFDDESIGGIPNVNTLQVAIHNKDKLNHFFDKIIQDGDILIFRKNHIYYMIGGVECVRTQQTILNGITIVINGKIQFTKVFGTKPNWPRKKHSKNVKDKKKHKKHKKKKKKKNGDNNNNDDDDDDDQYENEPDDVGCTCCFGVCKCCKACTCNEICPFTPANADANKFLPCMFFKYVTNVKFTSSTKPKLVKQSNDIIAANDQNDKKQKKKNKDAQDVTTRMPNAKFVYDWTDNDKDAGGGVIDGGGDMWYGNLRYFYREENRPRLLKLEYCQYILVENILFRKSPYWTFHADQCQYLEIRYCKCDARRRGYNSRFYTPHSMYQLAAYNTDGFDVGGRHSHTVYMHDLEIWNQDDCVAVKGGKDMVFERIRASGLGLVIGSIGVNGNHPVQVDNIIFDDCYMEDTVKGIYFKFRSIPEKYWSNPENKPAGIKNVVVNNVTMDRPKCPIWIGPAQQADSRKFWKADPVSLLWPTFAKFGFACNPPMGGIYENITLRNILINNPKPIPTQGLGVILAHYEFKMNHICFDNVKVQNVKDKGCFKQYSKHLFYYMGSNPEHGDVVKFMTKIFNTVTRESTSNDNVGGGGSGGGSGGNGDKNEKPRPRILNGIAKGTTDPIPGGFQYSEETIKKKK